MLQLFALAAIFISLRLLALRSDDGLCGSQGQLWIGTEKRASSDYCSAGEKPTSQD